jgi:trimethylamine--corrinoid protein Co-methyltransferase
MSSLAVLSVLTDQEISAIHEASIRVLSSTGIHLPHPEALELLGRAGAEVDSSRRTARIPEDLVMACLRDTGGRFELCGRNEQQQARFGYGERNYNSIFGEAYWIDIETRERRFATLDDVITAARVADALPGIGIAGAMADPHELPSCFRCVEVAAALLANTTKPIGLWFHDRASAKYLIELFAAMRGGAKELALASPAFPLLEPISPLSFTFNGVDLLFETGRVPLPVAVGPMAQTGATAPGTLAGTLVQENAEILAGICLVQLIHPGTPVCYGGIPHTFDMRTMQLIFAGPEQALMAVAMTQMGSRYGLPVYINVGLTDSKIPDAQAGLECGMTLLCGALSGADIFGHMGICGVDQATSLPMLVVQNEIIAYVERLMRGFAVNGETLAGDIIAGEGPGGNYMSNEHTVRHFRNELWFPGLLDRDFFENWNRAGRKTMHDRASEKLNEILRTHEPEPLENSLARELRAIVSSARKNLSAKA